MLVAASEEPGVLARPCAPHQSSGSSPNSALLAAIIDAAFLGGYFKTARQALNDVMRMGDSVGNPFLHLRNGQVSFEERKLDEAARELMRAYMTASKKTFADDDPKYDESLKTHAKDLE